MPMTMKLYFKDSTRGKNGKIAEYFPTEKQWWITSFNPNFKKIYQRSNLKLDLRLTLLKKRRCIVRLKRNGTIRVLYGHLTEI